MPEDVRLYTFECGTLECHVDSFEIALANTGSVLLTVDAAYTMDHWNEKALPGFLASAVDSVRSVRKLHRIAERSGSTVVTGHDPEAWPSFKHAPEHYD